METEQSHRARLRALQRAEDEREIEERRAAFDVAAEMLESVEAQDIAPVEMTERQAKRQRELCQQGAINRLI